MIHNTISQNIIRYDNTCLTFNDIYRGACIQYSLRIMGCITDRMVK